MARQTLRGTVRAHEMIDSPRAKHAPEAATRLGAVRLDSPGTYRLTLRAEAIRRSAPAGLSVSAVRLLPV